MSIKCQNTPPKCKNSDNLKNSVCLTIINNTNENIHIKSTNVNFKNLCWTLTIKHQSQNIVASKSEWTVVGIKSKRTYTTFTAPQNGKHLIIVDNSNKYNEIKCSANNKFNISKVLLYTGLISVLLAIVFNYYMNYLGMGKPTYNDCLNAGYTPQICKNKSLFGQLGIIAGQTWPKIILWVGLILGAILLILRCFLFGKCGNYFTKQDENVNCTECYNRGIGWNYEYPTEQNTSDKGFKLQLKQFKCRYADQCVCVNNTYRKECEKLSLSNQAGDLKGKLKWRSYLSSKRTKDDSKDKHNFDKSADNCACCTGVNKDSICIDVKSAQPFKGFCIPELFQ